MQQQELRPKFQVEELEGTAERTVYTRKRVPLLDDEGEQMRDSEGRKMWEQSTMEPKTITVDAGFMVYFPQGHSIHVQDRGELQRLGFDKEAPLVDNEGNEMPAPQMMSLKTHVKASTRGRSRRAAGGG